MNIMPFLFGGDTLNITRISDEESRAFKSGLTKLTACGNIIELMSLEKKNNSCPIVRLSPDYYCLASDYDKETGEVLGEIKPIEHSDSRADDIKSMARSMKACRDLINCNCSEVDKVRWITLTYAENMMDPKRLYFDRIAFWKRLKRWHKKNGLPVPEYITVAEPQGRGAWHLHELWVYPSKAPFLANKDVADLWGHGFVKVKRLDNCDNVGAYVTAYLCDIPLEDYEGSLDGQSLKDIELVLEDGTRVNKKFVKGARLSLYPPKMNFYRTSRGVKQPVVSWLTTDKAKEKVSAGTKTFSKNIRLETDGFTQDISYEYFNMARDSRQDN